MKKIALLLIALLFFFACTKSTIKKYGCAEPPLTGNLCVPNIFSPNGDGINDVLYVRLSDGTPSIDTMDFKILDGTGAILFYSSKADSGWDGSYNGKKKSGVYTYELKATLSNSQVIEYSGTVTCLAKSPNEYVVNDCANCRFDSQFDGHGNFDANLPSNEPKGVCE
jgi:gliding motility-associated-like protein